jgi:sugar phosphate isomerase/epimerase
MNIQGHNIGVCSWSLRPVDADDLIQKVRSLDLEHVQLALGGLLAMSNDKRGEEVTKLKASGLAFTAAMISFTGEDYASIKSIKQSGGYVPDDHWEVRKRLTLDAGQLAADMGIRALSTHIGFVPRSNDPHYAVIVDRICTLATALAESNVELLMETGQESSNELLQFLNTLSCKNVGINFDPANMILYGSGDPIDAIQLLGRHVRHVHVKDAIASGKPGLEWGREVAFGDGQVPHSQFIKALHTIGYSGPLVIEREAGEDRAADVSYAIETLQQLEAATDRASTKGSEVAG